MSSSLSVFGQRVRESVGFSSRSLDEDVEACKVKLTALERDVALLRKTLETSSLALSVQVPKARASMSDVLVRMGGSLSLSSDHYEAFKTAHEAMDGAGATKLQEVFARVIIGPLDEWLQTFADVRLAVAECDKARVVFDHYREKVTAMAEERRKLQMKGKIADKAAEEKMTRNIDKLKEAEVSFMEIRDRTVGRLLLCFDEAGFRLDFILLRTMQWEKQVLEDGLKTVSAWDTHIPALVAHAKERKIAEQGMDRLAACVTLARETREANGRLKLDAAPAPKADDGGFAAAAAATTTAAASMASGRGLVSKGDQATGSFHNALAAKQPPVVATSVSSASNPFGASAFDAPEEAVPAAVPKKGAFSAVASTLSSGGNPFGAAPAAAAVTATAAVAVAAAKKAPNPFGDDDPWGAASDPVAPVVASFGGGDGGWGDIPPAAAVSTAVAVASSSWGSAAAAAAAPAVASAAADAWGGGGGGGWDAFGSAPSATMSAALAGPAVPLRAAASTRVPRLGAPGGAAAAPAASAPPADLFGGGGWGDFSTPAPAPSAPKAAPAAFDPFGDM